jgi:PRTRC genetic system protein E
MFTELKTLLKQTGLTLVLEEKGEQIQVVVTPKVKAGSNVGLAQPLVLLGTAEELDLEFAAALAQFSGARLSLADQVAASTAAIEAAKKAAADKAKKPVTPGAKPISAAGNTVKPKVDDDDTLIFGATASDGASAGSDDDTGTDEEEGDNESISAPVVTAPATAAASDVNIFA